MNKANGSVIPTGVRPSSKWSNGVEEPCVRRLLPLLAFLLLAMFLSSDLLAQDLPQGWRRPTRSETSDEWRNKSPSRFLMVKGDFDGDGQPDVAEILINPSRKRWATFVKLAATQHWQPVGDQTEMGWLAGMGLRLVKPGRYQTACGKGYGEEFCAHGEPKYLKLSTDAIDSFKVESADVIIYWDQKRQAFRFIQMSD